MEMLNTSILDKLLHKDNSFCCLCFKIYEQDQTDLDDEVILFQDDLGSAQKISQMVSYVLGEEALADISTFQALCVNCATTIGNCYKFMKASKDNLKELNTVVENLSCCFEGFPDNFDDYDTLFISVNHDISVGHQYFHCSTAPIQNKADVLKTFKCITEIKDEKDEQSRKTGKEEKHEISPKKDVKKKNKCIVSTNEMINGKELQCKECLKEFSSVPNLRNHFLRLHAAKLFKCTECPRSYSTESLLKAHMSMCHVDVMCTECGKSFNSIHSLKVHEKGHFMKYVCPDCGRVYKNQSTYKKHFDNNICMRESRHSPADAKFTCDYCGKKYTQKISLRVHIQYEHGNKKYIHCEWCNKKFWCQSRLKAHIVKHTKEKNFQCNICNGKFVTKESLLYHTRIHTGEKPYACKHCDAKFISASRRIAHVRSHHMDTSVECDICHFKFKTPHYLAKHRKTHEKKSKILTDQVNPDVGIDSCTKENIDGSKNYMSEENSCMQDHNQKVVYNIYRKDNIFEMQIGGETSKKSFGKIEFLLVDSQSEESLQETIIDQKNEQVFYKVDDNEEYVIKVSDHVEI